MLIVDTGPSSPPPIEMTPTTAPAGPARRRRRSAGHIRLVVAEAAYLIDRQLDGHAEAALYTSITDGTLPLEDLVTADWHRVRELVG